MLSVNSQIFEYVKRNRRGKIFFTTDLRNTGSSDAVRQELSRLCRKGIIVRLSAGMYLYPKLHKYLGVLFPSVEEIIKSISRKEKSRLIPAGSYALNKLGLSTQVPMKIVFLTDGAPRVMKIGKKLTINLQKTTAKNLAFKGRITLLTVSALKEIGKDKVSDAQMNKIKEVLKHEPNQIIKHDAALAPEWISILLLKCLHHE